MRARRPRPGGDGGAAALVLRRGHARVRQRAVVAPAQRPAVRGAPRRACRPDTAHTEADWCGCLEECVPVRWEWHSQLLAASARAAESQLPRRPAACSAACQGLMEWGCTQWLRLCALYAWRPRGGRDDMWRALPPALALLLVTRPLRCSCDAGMPTARCAGGRSGSRRLRRAAAWPRTRSRWMPSSARSRWPRRSRCSRLAHAHTLPYPYQQLHAEAVRAMVHTCGACSALLPAA